MGHLLFSFLGLPSQALGSRDPFYMDSRYGLKAQYDLESL